MADIGSTLMEAKFDKVCTTILTLTSISTMIDIELDKKHIGRSYRSPSILAKISLIGIQNQML